MRNILRLSSLFVLSTLTFAQSQRIQIGSVIIGNTVNGITAIFVHLDQPTIQVTQIYDIMVEVNGRATHTKSTVGTIITPTEILMEASNLPGYLPPPPFEYLFIQIRMTKDGTPVSVALPDGSTTMVYGLQSEAMVPCRGEQYLKLGGVDTEGQNIPLYLKTVN